MEDLETDTIIVPPGTDIRLYSIPLFFIVIAAPPPLKAKVDLFFRPNGVSGLFTHDAGLDWPNHQGVLAATAYMAAGHPVFFQFEDLNGAEACHKRLVARAAA